MKRPKKPTRAQKEVISNNYLNPDNWLVLKETDTYIYLMSKDLKRRRTVDKTRRLVQKKAKTKNSNK